MTEMEVEVYDCGCKVRLYQADHVEVKDDLPKRPARVSQYTPCSRHRGNENPPRDARLLLVRGERDSFLNE